MLAADSQSDYFSLVAKAPQARFRSVDREGPRRRARLYASQIARLGLNAKGCSQEIPGAGDGLRPEGHGVWTKICRASHRARLCRRSGSGPSSDAVVQHLDGFSRPSPLAFGLKAPRINELYAT